MIPSTSTPPSTAKAAGYFPLAGPYAPQERWMLENVCADMRRGEIDFVIVSGRYDGLEVWRK